MSYELARADSFDMIMLILVLAGGAIVAYLASREERRDRAGKR